MALTQERLKELLHYDPTTGLFTWLIGRTGNARVGSLAGSTDEDGYVRIGVEGQSRRAHRLAWLYVHGTWPSADLDHIDENKSNNRISNLREATRKQNCQNKSKPQSNNTSGYLGVSPCFGKWRARIRTGKIYRSLGVFNTQEEASKVYLAAKAVHHTF